MANFLLQRQFEFFCQQGKVNKRALGGKNNKQLNADSTKSYSKDYLPALSEWLKTQPQLSFIEQDFLDIIPFLLSQGLFEECSRVLLRLHRFLTMTTKNKTLRNWRAAFNKYCLFIQTQYIDKKVRVHYSIKGTINVSNYINSIKTELDNYIVYYYVKNSNIIKKNGLKLCDNKYNLWKIFDNRLRSQNRTSGNKTWLSLDLVSKINTTALKSYVEDINSKTVLYYLDNNTFSFIECENIFCIALIRKNNSHKYKVYVLDNKTYCDHQVLTPTDIAGQKTPMEIDGIDKVVIDHVKPIDQSLRELTTAGKIPTLVTLSNYYKIAKYNLLQSGKKFTDNDVVNDAAILISKFGINKNLINSELNSLKSDSWYRLMDSDINGLKSNNVEFIEFRTDGHNKFIGVVLKANDMSGVTHIVYQDLLSGSNNYYIQDITRTVYKNSIDLTGYTTKVGKTIL